MPGDKHGENLNQRLILRQRDLISKLEDRVIELERERDALVESARSMVREFSIRLGEIEIERNNAVLRLRALQEYMLVDSE